MSPHEVIEAEQAERPDAIGPTMRLALTSRDFWLRSAALDFLPVSAMGEPEWAAFVAAATVDRSPLLRCYALEAVVRLRWQALADCVPPRLADSDGLVRVEAIEAVEALDRADWAGMLVPMLHRDPEKLVRGYAGWALVELRGDAACDELSRALAVERSPWARASLRVTLYPWRPDEHLAGLFRSLRSRNRTIRSYLCNSWPEPASEAHQAAMARALRAELAKETPGFAKEMQPALTKVEAAVNFGDLMLRSDYLEPVSDGVGDMGQ